MDGGDIYLKATNDDRSENRPPSQNNLVQEDRQVEFTYDECSVDHVEQGSSADDCDSWSTVTVTDGKLKPWTCTIRYQLFVSMLELNRVLI